MLLPRAPQARALLCLWLCLDLATAARFVGVRGDGGPTSAVTSPKMPSLSTSTAASPSPSTPESSGTESSSTIVDPTSSPTPVDTTPTTSVVSSMTAEPTAAASSEPSTGSFNSTIPDGELPLTPELTPAFAVAGVILMGTGAGYGFVGIKSKWAYSFMAAAYLASLGTAILILYVMTPPISDAIQGAYLVAVVVTGLVLGGAALVFKEITECLGSLLGGFCLSMWLLSLGSGGVVQATGAKVGFILAFTLAAFATYFSSWTRHYGLMTCISFAGATAAVLGIDCFSRAGLKEFWVYIWDLNDHLFPLGADTYPLTRGIQVELAATVLLAVAGMMSQLKIWRVIKKKRDQIERQRAASRRAVEREDLDIGRHVERMTHRERRRWERVYGDGGEKGFADSCVADVGSDVKLALTGSPVVRTSRVVVSPTTPSDDQFQMDEIPPPPADGGVLPSRRRTVLFQDTRATRASVRRSQLGLGHAGLQDGHGSESEISGADAPKIRVVGSDGGSRQEEDMSQTSRAFSTQPEIVPLPFTVTVGGEDEVPGDLTSVVADVDEEGEARSLPHSRRNSLANRLSVGSGKILRSLSQRSKAHTVASNENAGESREDLVVSMASRRYDDNSSMAATLDDLSSDGADSDMDDGGSRRHSEAGRPLSQEKRKSEEQSTRAWLSPAGSRFTDARLSTTGTDPNGPASFTEGAEVAAGTATETVLESKDTVSGREAGETASSETASQKARSFVSAASGHAALKAEHLPRPLSKVALSYRTNEWAKHLSHAETPEPDSSFSDVAEPIAEEAAAPVDVEELQKTAGNAVRPVAAPRSASATSNFPAVPQPISRTNSAVSLQQVESRNISPSGQSLPLQNPKRGPNNRRTSAQTIVEPIAEEGIREATASRSPTIPEEGTASGGPRSTSSASSPPLDPMQVPTSASASSLNLSRPPVPGVISYPSPQSLIGKRDVLLRRESHASFYASPPPGPHFLQTIHSQSDAGSMRNHAGLSPSSRAPSRGNSPADFDNLPLSSRRQVLLRQSSLEVPLGSAYQQQQQQPYLNLGNAASTTDFDSHQPIHRRASATALGTHHGPAAAAARQAQLASFRTSVQADLRRGSSFSPFAGGGGAGSPYAGPAAAAGPALPGGSSSSSPNLLPGQARWDRAAEQQRNFLIGQREAEARRREVERAEKARNDAEFEGRMRSGELLAAHRDALRRLQGGVRDSVAR